MIVVWSPEAIDDLSALRAFIGKDAPAAARRAVLGILTHVHEVLQRNPEVGRAGRIPGTRELVIARMPFIVPYRIKADTLQVLRVYHGRRRWPESL